MGDFVNAAIAASNLSDLLRIHGNLTQAVTIAQRGVELALEANDMFHLMRNITTLAAAEHALGRQQEAAALFQEAERTQQERQSGHPLLHSLPGFRYCDMLFDARLAADVLTRATQTLEWAGMHDVSIDVALDHLSLGRAHLLAAQRDATGDVAQAASHIKDSVDGLRRVGAQDYLPLGLLARAALHTHTLSDSALVSSR